MSKLELPIPTFQLDRWVYLILENDTLFVEGITESCKPFDLFKSVKINNKTDYSYTLSQADKRKDNF